MNNKDKILIPQHQNNIKNFYELGDDDGYFPSQDSAIKYQQESFKSNYHKNNNRALKLILKRNINLRNLKNFKIVNFGIGDGTGYLMLNINSKYITAIDISPHMIRLAKNKIKNLNYFLGGVEKLKKLRSNYFDLVMSCSVIGYLTEKHQRIFFNEAKRITKKNGFLLLMIGNELFDLFNLNAGTSDFFQKHFNQDKNDMKILLRKHNSKKLINAQRYNPINFKEILKKYGFNEIDQTFSQWHKKSTEITKNKYKNLRIARLKARDHKFDPNKLTDLNKWTALFRCSIFASLSKKI